jgi:hypothetical protein
VRGHDEGKKISQTVDADDDEYMGRVKNKRWMSRLCEIYDGNIIENKKYEIFFSWLWKSFKWI